MLLKIQDCLEWTMSNFVNESQGIFINLDDSSESYSFIKNRKESIHIKKIPLLEIVDFANGGAISGRFVLTILKSRNHSNKIFENVLEIATALKDESFRSINILINDEFSDLDIETISNKFPNTPYKIFMPSNPYDFCSLLRNSLDTNIPIFFLISTDILEVEGPVPDFKNDPLSNQGAELRQGVKGVTIIATGEDIFQACDVAEKLNCSTEIIEVRTLYPIDFKTIISSLAKTKKAKIIQTNQYLSSFNAYLQKMLKKYCEESSIFGAIIDIEKISAS